MRLKRIWMRSDSWSRSYKSKIRLSGTCREAHTVLRQESHTTWDQLWEVRLIVGFFVGWARQRRALVSAEAPSLILWIEKLWRNKLSTLTAKEDSHQILALSSLELETIKGRISSREDRLLCNLKTQTLLENATFFELIIIWLNL